MKAHPHRSGDTAVTGHPQAQDLGAEPGGLGGLPRVPGGAGSAVSASHEADAVAAFGDVEDTFRPLSSSRFSCGSSHRGAGPQDYGDTDGFVDLVLGSAMGGVQLGLPTRGGAAR